MTETTRPTRRAAILMALAAGGCGPIAQLQSFGEQLESATAPTDLYVLTPKSTFAEGLPEVRGQLVVEEPIAASQVNTDRIAIKPHPFQVEYFPESRWTDRAPLLVQRLLVESFENTGKVGSVSAQRISLASDYILLTDLREFQAEAAPAPGAPLSVNVQLNLKIVEERLGLIIASESFNHTADVATDAVIDVVLAFDEALGKALRDSVEWTVRQISGHMPREAPIPLDG